LDEAGRVLLEQRVSTTPKTIRELFRNAALPDRAGDRDALAMGEPNPSESGHEVIVAHARNVRLIGESRKKDDHRFKTP
jgi:transposase